METNGADTSSRAIANRSRGRAGDPTKTRFGALIVDDDDLIRVMLRLALEKDGFEVWAASGGVEAIHLFRRHRGRIDIVLMDVQMPDLDGPQTLDAIRKIEPDCRACFVSGDTGEYTPEDLIRHGAHAVFQKPFRLVDLVDAVRCVVNGERPIAADALRPEFRPAVILPEDLELNTAETVAGIVSS